MVKDQINEWLTGFVKHVNPPALEGVVVQKVSQKEREPFTVETSRGAFTADQVVVASGGYHQPIVPRMAEKLPKGMVQMHSAEYRNPQQLPEGKVLVVGCGQSGSQLAEDLHLAGREVVLATGDAPRCARFYRGKDVVDWLADMNYYDLPVSQHPLREGVRDNTNHYVTGRDGGRDIDLRKFAKEGMALYGILTDLDGDELKFMPNLKHNLDFADQHLQRHQRQHRQIHRQPRHQRPARRTLCAGVGAAHGAHQPEPEKVRHHLGDLVHRLLARLCVGGRVRLQRERRPGPPPRRDQPLPACTSWACPGCTPGAQAASPAWRGMRCTWPSRLKGGWRRRNRCRMKGSGRWRC